MNQQSLSNRHPGLLIIRDGWGVSEKLKGNAVKLASPPGYQKLLEECIWTTLEPGGEAVGLPDGQMGNSEVGHMNIGGGRVVYQDLPQINKDLRDNCFHKLPVFQDFLKKAMNSASVHLMGLFSDGGVHSHQDHFLGVLKILKSAGISNVFLHLFTDGRDTLPQSGIKFIEGIEKELRLHELGKIATLCGRYYAMDRDKNWDRIESAYDTLVNRKGFSFSSASQCLTEFYSKGITDEFIKPSIICEEGNIRSGDSVLFMNFRPDRARQLSFALEGIDFKHFKTSATDLNFISMTPYSADLKIPAIYTKKILKNTLSEVLCLKNKRQYKIAETEKYAHITYFLNGGREEKFDDEVHKIIPSPKVATYDLKPEMSAYDVTDNLLKAITSNSYDFLAVNFANPDMVGHTGNLDAAIQAVKVVDDCVDKLVQTMRQHGGSSFITADHGNLDEMIDHETGEVLTNHSLNAVDFIYVPRSGDHRFKHISKGGKLADIAPTILKVLDVEIPSEMNGGILLSP